METVGTKYWKANRAGTCTFLLKINNHDNHPPTHYWVQIYLVETKVKTVPTQALRKASSPQNNPKFTSRPLVGMIEAIVIPGIAEFSVNNLTAAVLEVATVLLYTTPVRRGWTLSRRGHWGRPGSLCQGPQFLVLLAGETSDLACTSPPLVTRQRMHSLLLSIGS